MAVNSKIIGTGDLNPGDSSIFRVPVTGKKENGRCIITSEKSTTTIQPMDYPDQVTSEILQNGTCLFLIDFGSLTTGEPGEYANFKVKKIK
ncbi:MAG: hypothetical protein ACO3EE_01305 [Flavobacteriales bacterium]